MDDPEPNQALPVYESRPPHWLPKAHPSADLGYLGFNPPRPKQDEDLLSETNITKGFFLGHVVAAETFSAQDIIHNRLANDNALSELEDLMNQVFARRVEHASPIPTSSFRMPSRVTLNDAKRQAWFADLANADVPLQKLSKSVPHGAKGHDLLDLLQSNNVAISRAVWFLRVFGANETAGLRNKPSYNPTQYSLEWANVMTTYMKKQLGDIALPSAPRPGLNIKHTFKGVLADADTRERWISRFSYCLKLLRTFYLEGLVDNRSFLSWLVQQMGCSNLAQAGFLARLADEYLDDMLSRRALSRPFVDACLAKISEIRNTSPQEYLLNLDAMLRFLLQRICVALPDAFVCPRTWTSHSALLSDILTGKKGSFSVAYHSEEDFDEVDEALLGNFSTIKRRNEAMLFYDQAPCGRENLRSAVSDIQLLNSITSTTDLDTLPLFESSAQDFTFRRKVDTLLTWSVTPLQFGKHRPFAAVTLLRVWRMRANHGATGDDLGSLDDLLQDHIFDWLDSCDVESESINVPRIAVLLEKLVEHHLFSYAKYIQRLIARGEPGLLFTEELGSRHREFLRCIPIPKSMISLINQRRVTLYGARARITPEVSTEREIRRELRMVLSELFGGDEPLSYTSTAALLGHCPTFTSASRFEQVRTLKHWLLPILQSHISKQSLRDSTLLRSYCVSVGLMSHAFCYDSILDLSLSVLAHSLTASLLTAVLDTIHRHTTIWACMQALPTIVTVLYTAHQTWRASGVQSRALLALLMEIDNETFLDATAKAQVATDISAFAHALLPATEQPDMVPPVLPEILHLANDTSPEAPSSLANALWYNYRTASDWGWVVWDNTVASLRRVPLMTSDLTGRRTRALLYGNFLLHVDEHLPNGLNDQVLKWFLGNGKSEAAVLDADTWEVLTVVLLFLALRGALATTTILQGLIYPAWHLAANTTAENAGNTPEVFLTAANNLANQLLVQWDENASYVPQVDLLDEQRIRTRQQDQYREPHFLTLLSNILTLVRIENNSYISETLRFSSKSIRQALGRNADFHRVVNQNLEAVRNFFDQAMPDKGADQQDTDCIIEALRTIWWRLPNGESAAVDLENWSGLPSLLSPWKLASTAIQLQFILRRLEWALSDETTSQAADSSINKLTATVFHHPLSWEEARFLAEIVSGVGVSIAAKFINNGMQYLGDILEGSLARPDTLSGFVERAGEVLRFLAHIAQMLRGGTSTLPPLNSAVQDKFIRAVQLKFSEVEFLLSAPPAAESATQRHQANQATLFLARLLHFDLGFSGVWTSATREISNELCLTLLRLALLHGSGENLDCVAYHVMIDTLCYLIDEIPPDPKNPTFEPFRNYPTLSPAELPADLPPEYRRHLCTLLPYTASNASVSNLAIAHRDANGNLVHGPQVLNRPWEWVEYLGDNPAGDSRDEEKDKEEGCPMRHPVRNSGSLSLETFGARITGEGIIQNIACLDDVRVAGNLRTFEDGLSAESIYERDWRETRIELDKESSASPGGRSRGEEEDELSPLTSFATARRATTSSHRPSPAPSVQSRGSAASRRQSPHRRLSATTRSDGVEMDNGVASASNGAKRRSASAEGVEAGNEPHLPPRQSKRGKTKTTTKTRAKKR